MAQRPGCEDYVPSLDFVEAMPGDDPKAIAAFVKAIREGIEKNVKETPTPTKDEPAKSPRSIPKLSRSMWADAAVLVAVLVVWHYFGTLAGLLCLSILVTLEGYQAYKVFRSRLKPTPQEEELIAALSRKNEVQ